MENIKQGFVRFQSDFPLLISFLLILLKLINNIK